jgi:hypothetical protein
MNRKTIAFGAIAWCSFIAPAAAQDTSQFSVRNATDRILTCGLRRTRGSMNDLFVVRPGSSWTQPTSETTPRLLQCDVNRLPLQARIHPGVDYVLLQESGMVVLRVAAAR